MRFDSLLLYDYLDRSVIFLLFVVVILVTLSTANSNAASNDRDFTTQDVVEGIQAADAQFSNLDMDYIRDLPDSTDTEPMRRELSEIRYAQKLPEGWLYYHKKYGYYDSIVGAKSEHDEAESYAVFDGSATTVLDNPLGEGQSASATIYVGRRDVAFPMTEIPLTWLYDRTAAYISQNDGVKFEVTKSDDVIENIHAIRLEGNYSNGSLTKIWFAPELSFLMVHKENWFPPDGQQRRVMTHEISDFFKLENGMWYPRSMRIGFLNEPGHYTTIKMVRVSTLPLKQNVFQLTMPPRTKVADFTNNQTYITIDPTTHPAVTTQDVEKSETSLKQYLEDARQQQLSNQK